MIVRQTVALFVDAYRELSAGRVFWISIALSVAVVAAFAVVGIEAGKGVTVLGWTLPGTTELSELVEPSAFYVYAFLVLGVGLWLTWVATILGLVSTASIFPSLVASGSIEAVLSKPIGRVRLFLTKYVTGLLFVSLQLVIVVGGSLVVIGVRGGTWEWGILLAVPIVLVFFSYLFSVCALIGLITRSSVTALLLTVLFWLLLSAVNATDGTLMQLKASDDASRARAEAEIRALEPRIPELRAELGLGEDDPIPEEAGASASAEDVVSLNRLRRGESRLASARSRVEKAETGLAGLNTYHGYVVAAKTPLPKTSETIDLLNRWLFTAEELELFVPDGGPPEAEMDDETFAMLDASDRPADVPGATKRLIRMQRERGLWWVLGTSFAFEALVLGLAATIFVRREF